MFAGFDRTDSTEQTAYRTWRMNMNLSVDFAGVLMKNPVTTASGTFGSGAEYGEYVDLNRLGAD